MRLLKDIWDVFVIEVQRVLHDKGVILIFFIATLLYPLIFGAIYRNELVRHLPVAVVDESRSEASHRFIHKLDATPEMRVDYHCCNMAEAKHLMQQRRIHGIVLFPHDYDYRLAHGETARVCLFCDMSSFLYYRSVLSGTSAVLLDEMQQVEVERYGLAGITGEGADELVQPIPFDDVKLYSPAGGFTSFLVPALLVLVVHQTLFLGIGILVGTAREDRRTLRVIPPHLRLEGRTRVVVGRALAYLALYLPIVAVDLVLMPRGFGLPHIGRIGDLCVFLLPFMLATVFFCMTVCSFVRERDTGIITCIFFSVVLLFLSGAIWPSCNMPSFWRLFSYLFPSTHGIQGFIRINTMGATLAEVKFEYLMLWLQTALYFATSCLCLRAAKRFKIGVA